MNIFFIILIVCLIIYLYRSIYMSTYEHFTIKDTMKNSSIIIVGTCRDVSAYIDNIIQSIDKCGEKFNFYHVVIFENDSSDDTREKLIKGKKFNYTYLFEDGLVSKEKSRTKRLEYARNKILNTVRQINKFSAYEYLLIVDMDNVNAKGTFADTIENCFDPSIDPNSWAVQTANQQIKYYDRWALRIPKFFNYDCWLKIKKHGRTEENIKKYAYPFFISFNYEKNGLLVPVKSAFGGTALYKLNSIPSYCKYNGSHLTGQEKCEHVDFHKCIGRASGKIFINTQFINDA